MAILVILDNFGTIFEIWAKAANFGQKVKKLDFTETVKDNEIKPKGGCKGTLAWYYRPQKTWIILAILAILAIFGI